MRHLAMAQELQSSPRGLEAIISVVVFDGVLQFVVATAVRIVITDDYGHTGRGNDFLHDAAFHEFT